MKTDFTLTNEDWDKLIQDMLDTEVLKTEELAILIPENENNCEIPDS